MPVHDPTAANTRLWSAYFDEGWARLLDPLGQRYFARAVAAGVAGWLNVVLAPQISAWYAGNAPEVSRFLADHGTPATETVVVPAEYRRIAEPGAPPIAADPALQAQSAPTSAR